MKQIEDGDGDGNGIKNISESLPSVIQDEILSYLSYDEIFSSKLQECIPENDWKRRTIREFTEIMDTESHGTYDKWWKYYQYLNFMKFKHATIWYFNFQKPLSNAHSLFDMISDNKSNEIDHLYKIINEMQIADILIVDSKFMYFLGEINNQKKLIVSDTKSPQPSQFEVIIDYPLSYWPTKSSLPGNDRSLYLTRVNLNLTKLLKTHFIVNILPDKLPFTQIIIITYQNISYALVSKYPNVNLLNLKGNTIFKFIDENQHTLIDILTIYNIPVTRILEYYDPSQNIHINNHNFIGTINFNGIINFNGTININNHNFIGIINYNNITDSH